jgi:hypothetical protein
MSISIELPRTQPAIPFVDKLHQWVITVDHKRLGLLYIAYAVSFLLIGGIEATTMRIQLIRPHNDFVSPQVFNQMFTMHGTTMIFFVIELFASPDDRRARHGVSALERVQFLVDGLRRNPALLQLHRRLWSVRRRERSGRGVVCLCPIDFEDVLARPQHGFLDSLSAGLRFWQHRDGDQHHRYRSVHALPGNDPRQDALAGLA